MLARPLRALIAPLICVAILTGCTADANPKSTGTPAPIGAQPLAAGVSDPPGTVTETKVTASSDLREQPSTYLGAMHEATAQNGAAVVPTRNNAAALITAFDEDNNVLARAVTVQLDGFEPTREITVDYTSTAFTRLLALPTYVTDNPLAVMVLRGAAEQSPNLPRLAEAIKKNASVNPTFESETTPAEDKALAALSRDVRATLAQVAADVAPSRMGAARSAPSWAVKQQVVTQAALPEDSECLSMMDTTGAYTPWAEDTSVFCAKASANDDGTYEVDIDNEAAVWGFIYAHDGNTSHDPRLVGIANPYAFVLPDLDAVVSALLHATTKALVTAATGLVCDGASWLGIECPQEWATEFSPSAFFEDIKGQVADDLEISKGGNAVVVLTDKEAANELAILTPARGDDPVGFYPAPFDGIDTPGVTGAMAVGSVYTSMIEPLLGLVLGDSVANLTGPQGRSDKNSTITGCTIAPTHRKEQTCAGKGSLVEALIIAVAKSEDIAESTNAVIAAFATDDLNEALPTLADFALKVVTDKGVLDALFGNVTEDVVADALQTMLTDFGVKAVPGIGWLETANDIGLPLVNATIGGWNMFQAFMNTPRHTFIDAPHPSAARILANYDWAGPAYTYEGYFNDGDGEGFLPFHLNGTEDTATDMPGVSDIRLTGVTYGTIYDAPVALVAIQMTPEGPLEVTGPYLCVYLINVDPDTRTPVTTALFTDYPTYENINKVVYTVENDKVVSYSTYPTGSSGAAQDDLRKVYRTATQDDLPDPDDPYDDTDYVLPSVATLVLDETTYVPPAASRDGITWESAFVPAI